MKAEMKDITFALNKFETLLLRGQRISQHHSVLLLNVLSIARGTKYRLLGKSIAPIEIEIEIILLMRRKWTSLSCSLCLNHSFITKSC